MITDAREVRKALRAFRAELSSQFGRPRIQRWSFPGGGGRDDVPTWYREAKRGPLAVAMGREGDWDTRTPVFLARSPIQPLMTPTVELNVPSGTRVLNRLVNGCFCLTDRGEFVLAHRGGSLTVTPWVISKKEIHRHFAKLLQPATDGDQETDIIPVGPVGPRLAHHMAVFADAVAVLKKTWAAHGGNAAKARRQAGWREDLNFPDKIERALVAGVKTFEYRHGPMQSDLRQSLSRRLRPCCRIVLNANVDLAIRHGKKVLALFEVKTGVGPQIFSGIGQLLCYRAQFGDTRTPLFLVIPRDAASDTASELGRLLRRLGIELMLASDGESALWDGRHLESLLTSIRAHHRRDKRASA